MLPCLLNLKSQQLLKIIQPMKNHKGKILEKMPKPIMDMKLLKPPRNQKVNYEWLTKK